MNECRFEDRLAGVALVMRGLRERIAAKEPGDLPAAFARIEAARAQGAWIALLLEYELGEWLEPSLLRFSAAQGAAHRSDPEQERLVALVFDRMEREAPWGTGDARVCSVTPELSEASYIGRVDRIRDWIAAGDVYQVNATFGLKVDTEGSATNLYRRIANANPTAHAAYIEDARRTVLSFSPELFLARTGHTLVTRPMKGTAPRSQNAAEDQALAQRLLASDKDRAENLMIVDLLRNDMGRIAAPGSVRADPLFTLEKYPTVWTMTSTIHAMLRDGVDLGEILHALFPCGSVTGAPKIAAMEKILLTEPSRRGLYCGSIGWLSPSGDFSLNVAIRTLVLDSAGEGRYGVGGGIVHDSDPGREWNEAHWKARILTQAMSWENT